MMLRRALCAAAVACAAGLWTAQGAAADMAKAWERGVLGDLEQREFRKEYVHSNPYWVLGHSFWWVRGKTAMEFAGLPLSDVLVEWEEVELAQKPGAPVQEVVGVRPARVLGVLFKDVADSRVEIVNPRRLAPLRRYFDGQKKQAARVKTADSGVLWSTKLGEVEYRNWGDKDEDRCYFKLLTLKPDAKRKPVNTRPLPEKYDRRYMQERLKACKIKNGARGGEAEAGALDVVLTLAVAEWVLGANADRLMKLNRMVRRQACPGGERARDRFAKLSRARFLSMYPPGSPRTPLRHEKGSKMVPPILAEVHEHIDKAPLLWLASAPASARSSRLRGRLRLIVDCDVEQETISWVEFHERALLRGTSTAAEAQQESELRAEGAYSAADDSDEAEPDANRDAEED